MSKFQQLENKLAKRKGVTNPGALAAYIGREKYGAKGMERKAKAGVRAARASQAHQHHHHAKKTFHL